MKITEELLRQMGFRESSPGWWEVPSLSGSYLLKLSSTWEFDHHMVTDVEEMIFFAYRDGLEDGKIITRQEVREALGIKNGGGD